jgi:CRP-like cAMP-binding protein
MYRKLAHTPLFREISEDKLETLLQKIPVQRKKYHKDELIALKGDPCDGLYIVLEGAVKAEMFDGNGKTVNIETIHGPQTIAEAFVFGDVNEFPVDVIALSGVDLLLIPKEGILKLFALEDVILKHFLDSLSSRTQFLSKKLWMMSFKTLRSKIAAYLLEQSKHEGFSFKLNASQEELARNFGVTRPSLTRALGELEKEGLITVNRKYIEILDEERLKLIG